MVCILPLFKVKNALSCFQIDDESLSESCETMELGGKRLAKSLINFVPVWIKAFSRS